MLTMRWSGVVVFLLLTVCGFAIDSNQVQVNFGVSRTGLAANTKVYIHIFGVNERVAICNGEGKSFVATPAGQNALITVNLNNSVNDRSVRRVWIQVDPPGREPVTVNHLSVYLGSSYPRTMLLDELQTPVWNGTGKFFGVNRSTSELGTEFDSIRITGRVVDSVYFNNKVEFWIETIDGKMLIFNPTGNLRNEGNFSSFHTLGSAMSRGTIKRFRIYSGRSNTWRVTSFIDLFRDSDDVRLRDIRIDGGKGGRFYPIYSSALIDLQNHGLYQSPDLSGGIDTMIREYRPTWFNVYIFTGNDDLRWDPNVQPNMEIKVNLYVKGNRTPIPIVSRSLNPYAPFANGGVWGGSFAGYDIAERKAPWRDNGRPPRIQDIESIEVETIAGWDGSTPERAIIRGQGDPFRQPDTWSFRGIWVGVSDNLPNLSSGDTQILAPWHTILCDFSRVVNVKQGQKVRLPVKVTLLPGR